MKKAHGSNKGNGEGHLSSKRHPPSKDFGERPPHLSKMNELLLEKHLQDRMAPKVTSEDDMKVYSLQETQHRLMERLGMQDKQKTHDSPDVPIPEVDQTFQPSNSFYDEFLTQIGAELGDDDYDEEQIEKLSRIQSRWDAIRLEACNYCKVKRETAPPHVDPTTIRCQYCIGDKRIDETESEYVPKRKAPKLEVIVEVHRNDNGEESKAKAKRSPKSSLSPHSIKYMQQIQKSPNATASSNLPNVEDGPPTLYPSGLSPPLQNHSSPPILQRSVGSTPVNIAKLQMQQVKVSSSDLSGAGSTISNGGIPLNLSQRPTDGGAARDGMVPLNLGSGGGTAALQQYVNNTGTTQSTIGSTIRAQLDQVLGPNSMPGQSATNGIPAHQISPPAAVNAQQAAALMNARAQQLMPNISGAGTYRNEQQQQILTHNTQQTIHTSLSGANSASEQPKNLYRVAGTHLHPQSLAPNNKVMEINKPQAAATSTAVSQPTHPQPLKVAQPVTAMPLVGSTPKVDPSIIATPLPGTTSKTPITLTTPAPPQPISIPTRSTATGQTSPGTKATPIHQPLVLLMQQADGKLLFKQLPQGTVPLTSPTTHTITGQVPGLPTNNASNVSPPQNVKQKVVSPGGTIQKFISIPATSPPLPQSLIRIQQGSALNQAGAVGLNLVKFPSKESVKLEEKIKGTIKIPPEQNLHVGTGLNQAGLVGLNFVKMPSKESTKLEEKIKGTIKIPPEQNLQAGNAVNVQVTGTKSSAIHPKANIVAHTTTSAMSKNLPKPISLTTPSQAILESPAQQESTPAQLTKGRLLEQVANTSHCKSAPQAVEVRATLDDLINAADTVECGNEVANLTQVGIKYEIWLR